MNPVTYIYREVTKQLHKPKATSELSLQVTVNQKVFECTYLLKTLIWSLDFVGAVEVRVT